MEIKRNDDNSRIIFNLGEGQQFNVKRLGQKQAKVKEWFARTFHLNNLFPNYGAVKFQFREDGATKVVYLDKKSLVKHFEIQNLLTKLDAKDDGKIDSFDEEAVSDLITFLEETDKIPQKLDEVEQRLKDVEIQLLEIEKKLSDKMDEKVFKLQCDKYKKQIEDIHTIEIEIESLINVHKKFRDKHEKAWNAIMFENINPLTALFGKSLGVWTNKRMEACNRLEKLLKPLSYCIRLFDSIYRSLERKKLI